MSAGKGNQHLASPGQPSGAAEAYDALINLLKALAHQPGERSGKGGAKRKLLVFVLDEVDRLLDKGPDEVYKLFMLPHVPGRETYSLQPVHILSIPRILFSLGYAAPEHPFLLS